MNALVEFPVLNKVRWKIDNGIPQEAVLASLTPEERRAAQDEWLMLADFVNGLFSALQIKSTTKETPPHDH